MKIRSVPEWFSLLLALGMVWMRADAAPLPVELIRLPPGFAIEVFSQQVPGAREMALGPSRDGTTIVYVGSNGDGVFALMVKNGHVVSVHKIAKGLQAPIGVAYRDGDLYVSSISRILRLRDIDQHIALPPAPEVVTDQFPSDTHHGAKFIAFGPDGLLYVPVGAPCNICEPDPDRYANIQTIKTDNVQAHVYATGIRNSVGFDWNPQDNTLWFTDNGRDEMGDDLPSDKLNHAQKSGENFGYPYCHQGDVADPKYGSQHPCSDFVAPSAKLGAHVASLGMRFYTGTMFPVEFARNIFIAEHGSWNRSHKVGYRVVRVTVNADGETTQSAFAEGWLQVFADGTERVWGRPTDVLVMPDGALLVSDDQAGAIYRISYMH